ncbi:unnamed protein product [marine sediment metagenome]|uniref:DinB superfamily protein n=1 Tax=marine sediment metagenome TaxID=412755 RepID=X1B990_9ZZZZ
MTESLNRVMQRNLQQLKKEMAAYANEKDLWLMAGEIPNSAGTLCLHLCGNLQHYIGAVLGNSSYIRQRDAEFTIKNVPEQELQLLIDTTMKVVSNTLRKLESESLTENYPEQIFSTPMTTEYFLIHLASHLGYHLGQINYHRRLLAVN